MKPQRSHILKDPFPWCLVMGHAAIVMLLLPLILATNNSEVGPLGLGLLALLDFSFGWLPEAWTSFHAHSLISLLFKLFLIGSLQWYLIGLIYVLIRNRLPQG